MGAHCVLVVGEKMGWPCDLSRLVVTISELRKPGMLLCPEGADNCRVLSYKDGMLFCPDDGDKWGVI